jgi:nucleoid DNA-binding protein
MILFGKADDTYVCYANFTGFHVSKRENGVGKNYEDKKKMSVTNKQPSIRVNQSMQEGNP